MPRRKRLQGVIDIMPTFKVGDLAPTGYLEWHEWSKVQYQGGLRQSRCLQCGLWMFPQESCNCGGSNDD